MMKQKYLALGIVVAFLFPLTSFSKNQNDRLDPTKLGGSVGQETADFEYKLYADELPLCQTILQRFLSENQPIPINWDWGLVGQIWSSEIGFAKDTAVLRLRREGEKTESQIVEDRIQNIIPGDWVLASTASVFNSYGYQHYRKDCWSKVINPFENMIDPDDSITKLHLISYNYNKDGLTLERTIKMGDSQKFLTHKFNITSGPRLGKWLRRVYMGSKSRYANQFHSRDDKALNITDEGIVHTGPNWHWNPIFEFFGEWYERKYGLQTDIGSYYVGPPGGEVLASGIRVALPFSTKLPHID